MNNVKRIMVFALVMIIAMTMLAIPVSAAGYVPSCYYCGNTDIWRTGREEVISLGDQGYYISYEFKCNRCGCSTWIDSSLID